MSTKASYQCPSCGTSIDLEAPMAIVDAYVGCPCPVCTALMAPMSMTYAEECNMWDSDYLGESRSYRIRQPPRSFAAMPEGSYHTTLASLAEDIRQLREQNTSLEKRLTAAHAKADQAIARSETAAASARDADVNAAKAATSLAKANASTESLRQSVMDQAATITQLTNGAVAVAGNNARLIHETKLVTDRASALEYALRGIRDDHDELQMLVHGDDDAAEDDDEDAIAEADSLVGRLGTAERKLKATRRRVRAIEGMSYIVEETPTPAAEATTAPQAAVVATTTPALGDVAKVIGGAIFEGGMLGLTTQFISEATDLMVKRALANGLITPALAESTVFKESLKLGIPMMLLAIGQYPQVPKSEFLGKIGAIAVKGKTAEHSATVMAFGMSMVSDMLALPSASKLEAQLSAAE